MRIGRVRSDFRPRLMTTGVGSLPFKNGEEAASFVFDAGLSIPFWPQLPKRHFLEQMVPQYSEGMPCVRNEPEQARTVLDTSEKYRELEGFYELLLDENPDHFALSETSAEGFHAFVQMAAGRTWPIVKGQTAGPITLSTSVKSRDGEAVYGDPDLRDAAVKLLTRTTQWQMARLKPFAAERVLMFVDEPVLAAYGSSAYVGLSEQHVHVMDGEVFDAIEAAGGISGIHVCGNSDWGMVMRTGVQVVNFDAYEYGTTIALYPEEVNALFERGGCIAWGIVPTTDAVRGETTDSLARRLDACFDALAEKGFSQDLVKERSMLTPSCGAGALSVADTRKVFGLLRNVQRKFLGEEH